MASGQVIRLVNEGDSTFSDMYGGQVFTIPAGEQMFVDFDAMCLWLGHPEANDFDPRNRVRVAEFHRLRSRYGVDARTVEMTLLKQPVDSEELFQQLRPKLVAYDASSNTQIMTVADDPSGDSLSAVSPEISGNQDLILARMAQMEQEMVNLRAQLATNQRTEQALNDAQPIEGDNPDLRPDQLPVGGSGIVGTVQEAPNPADSSLAPRPTPRTDPGEDAPNRVRVTS